MKCPTSSFIQRLISAYLHKRGWERDYGYRGYTEATYDVDGEYENFRCYDKYKGYSWYDMCLVEFVNPVTGMIERKAARILTIIRFDRDIEVVDPYISYIVVQLSKELVSVKKLEKKFMWHFTLNDRYEILPASCIRSPLAIWYNSGGENDEHFCVLPRRKWAGYFSREILSNLRTPPK